MHHDVCECEGWTTHNMQNKLIFDVEESFFVFFLGVEESFFVKGI